MQEEAVPRSVLSSTTVKARAVSFAEELEQEHPLSPLSWAAAAVDEKEETAPAPTTATGAVARPPAVDTTRVEFIPASPAPSTPSTPLTASVTGGLFRQGMLTWI
ncbi:hypothetical protein BASA81_003199 [Batrachochytrium salamandrivorans]|nr:hypothetical protein BASA81_003199 [Batrachochytrium salamandrivorans]